MQRSYLQYQRLHFFFVVHLHHNCLDAQVHLCGCKGEACTCTDAEDTIYTLTRRRMGTHKGSLMLQIPAFVLYSEVCSKELVLCLCKIRLYLGSCTHGNACARAMIFSLRYFKLVVQRYANISQIHSFTLSLQLISKQL